MQAADVDAAPLVDVVILTDAQRPTWEARLLPYRHAVVVPHDARAASTILSEVPGSLLVHADPSDGTTVGRTDLPDSADPRFRLTTFLAALADRAGAAATHIDTTADVHAISSFKEPLTGRAGRIQEARAVLATATTADEAAEEAVSAAEREYKRAGEREEAAQAGAEAARISLLVADLRRENDANEEDQRELASPIAVASEGYQQALADKSARDTLISVARGRATALERERDEAARRWDELTSCRENLDLAGRHAAWGGTVGDANATF